MCLSSGKMKGSIFHLYPKGGFMKKHRKYVWQVYHPTFYITLGIVIGSIIAFILVVTSL